MESNTALKKKDKTAEPINRQFSSRGREKRGQKWLTKCRKDEIWRETEEGVEIISSSQRSRGADIHADNPPF